MKDNGTSPDLQEIIGRAPTAFERYTVPVLAVLCLSAAVLGIFVKIPVRMTAPATVYIQEGKAIGNYASRGIGYIGPGEKAVVSLNGFPSSDFGTLDAIVDSVSSSPSMVCESAVYCVFCHLSDTVPKTFRSFRMLDGTMSISVCNSSKFKKIKNFKKIVTTN